jgi:eukaryotic-like serine/threonine-protein kinase
MAAGSRRTWIIVLIVVLVVVAIVIAALLVTSRRVTVPDVKGKSQAEAAKLLEDAGLKLGAVTPTPAASAKPGVIVAQEPAAGANADKGSAVAVTVSSGPGTAAVPDVVGMAEAKAMDTLQSDGFTSQSARQYDAVAPEGEVMAQLPTAGMQAFEGSTVGLLVSLGHPSHVTVPDVSGMTQEEATSTLATESLVAVPVDAYDDQVPKGSVASQEPTAGVTVTPLSEIIIVVSLGKGTTTVTVPDVVGQSQTAAVDALKAAGLGATTAQAFSSSVTKGYVIAQDPAAGAKVEQGGKVGLLVSLGGAPKPSPTPTNSPSPAPSASSPPPSVEPTLPPDTGVPLVKVPDVVGLTSEEAGARLTDLGLRPVPLKAPSAPVAANTVIAQLPAADESVPKTYPVLLLVSLGPPAQVNPVPASQ